jgi:hypothetical protein
MWEVVGGADKGGIIVREGYKLQSKALEDRLSTGSVIEELELVGDRLHYKLNKGSGPQEGWISLKVKDKPMVQMLDRVPNGVGDESIGDRTSQALAKKQISAEAIEKKLAKENGTVAENGKVEQAIQEAVKDAPTVNGAVEALQEAMMDTPLADFMDMPDPKPVKELGEEDPSLKSYGAELDLAVKLATEALEKIQSARSEREVPTTVTASQQAAAEVPQKSAEGGPESRGEVSTTVTASLQATTEVPTNLTAGQGTRIPYHETSDVAVSNRVCIKCVVQ